MVKKVFLVFLLVLVLIIGNAYFQKKRQLSTQTQKSNVDKSNTIQPSGANSKTAISTKIFLELSEPKTNTTVNKAIINVSGKTIANGYVFVNDQDLRADASGNFTTGTTLDEGENEIVVVASDDAGNSVEKDIIINLETTK